MNVDVKNFAEPLPKPYFERAVEHVLGHAPELNQKMNLDRFMEHQSSKAARQRRLTSQYVV